jgi:hypothetical protein
VFIISPIIIILSYMFSLTLSFSFSPFPCICRQTFLEYSIDEAHWDPDSKYNSCPYCNISFHTENLAKTGLSSGRHHCRMCGSLVCSDCSRGSLNLPAYVNAQRVCKQCHTSVLDLRKFFAVHLDILVNNVKENKRK